MSNATNQEVRYSQIRLTRRAFGKWFRRPVYFEQTTGKPQAGEREVLIKFCSYVLRVKRTFLQVDGVTNVRHCYH
jgi:hypothetical protein